MLVNYHLYGIFTIMITADIYPSGSHQMRHCDPCEMPSALQSAPDSAALYSVTKHAIMETQAEWDNPDGLEFMRARHEENGTIEVFEAALKCIRCAEGLSLIIDGRETGWRVGGNRAVGQS